MNHEELKSILAKLRPVIGEMADAFWLSAILEPERTKDVLAVSNALAAELLGESYVNKHILLEPPPAGKVRGEYPMGTVVYADKPMGIFCLRNGDMPQHLMIVGRSGAGKTNIGFLLVWNLLRAEKPFIILDWRGNFSHFLNRPEGKDIKLFSLGEEESLCFNPLDAPGNLTDNQRDAYLRDVVSVVCNTFLPGQLLTTKGVDYFFLKAIEDLEPHPEKPITFKDISRYLMQHKARSREREWKIAAMDVLFKLTSGPIGRVMNGDGNATLDGVLNKPIILDMKGLGGQTDRSFFTQVLLLWVYYHRLSEGKSDTFKHAIIVEEAHHMFLQRRGEDQTIHDLLLRQFREFGESLILLDQNPSLLSTPALGNTGITIALNLKHMNDVEAAGKSLTLPKEEWHYIGRLPVGYGIVKMQDRWVKPFLVSFPQFPVISDYQPSKVERRRSGSDLVRRSIEEFQSALNEAIRVIRETDRRENNEGQITIQERSLLLDIASHPLSVVTERYSRLGWNVYAGTKVKENLLEKGLVGQEKVSVPNGSVTLLKSTEKGKILLESLGMKLKDFPKNASLEHEYWKQRIAEDYRSKGYEVVEEMPIGEGKSVDLVAKKDGEEIAIEIETGKSDTIENINKDLNLGFSRVILVTTSNGVKRETEKQVKNCGLSNDQRLEIREIGKN